MAWKGLRSNGTDASRAGTTQELHPPAAAGLRMIDRVSSAIGGRAHSQSQLNTNEDEEVAEITASMDAAANPKRPADEHWVAISPATIPPCATRQRSMSATSADPRRQYRHAGTCLGSPVDSSNSSSGSSSNSLVHLCCPRPILAWQSGDAHVAALHEAYEEASHPTASTSETAAQQPCASSPSRPFGAGHGLRRRAKKYRTSRLLQLGLPAETSCTSPVRHACRENHRGNGNSSDGALGSQSFDSPLDWPWLSVSSPNPKAGSVSGTSSERRRASHCRLPRIDRHSHIVSAFP